MPNNVIEDNSESYFEPDDVEFVHCQACGHTFVPEERDPEGVYECPECHSIISDERY